MRTMHGGRSYYANIRTMARARDFRYTGHLNFPVSFLRNDLHQSICDSVNIVVTLLGVGVGGVGGVGGCVCVCVYVRACVRACVCGWVGGCGCMHTCAFDMRAS